MLTPVGHHQRKNSNFHKYSSSRKNYEETWDTSHVLTQNGEDPVLTIMKLEKELRKLRRENQKLIDEVGRLNRLVEQMKNIEDDELLMVEKIQTKEIYGKAQKLKISDLQKETQKIRIEKDRLKVVNVTNERIIKERDSEIITLKERISEMKRRPGQVVVKTEFRNNPEQDRRIRELQQDLHILRSSRSKVQTVSARLAKVIAGLPGQPQFQGNDQFEEFAASQGRRDQQFADQNRGPRKGFGGGGPRGRGAPSARVAGRGRPTTGDRKGKHPEDGKLAGGEGPVNQ